MRRGNRNREVVIQYRAEDQDEDDGTPVGEWLDLTTVFAEVQDLLPSRAEGMPDGISIARRPSRVRMLYRDDVTSKMQFKLPARSPAEGDRVLRIISGPAEIGGYRDRVEFVAEELSTAGQEP